MRRAIGLAFLVFLGPLSGAVAQERPTGAVDLQLVLAVDASGSVSTSRFDLQSRGYAAAFRHPRVLAAIRSGIHAAIAVTMVQWTGPALQIQVIPWRLINDAASTEQLAAEIEGTPRQLFGGGTSISGAIDYGVALMPTAPFKGLRRTIDISGDGSNNRGRSVTQSRDEAVAAGVVINGLPILELEPMLDRYFQDNVIGGPGAFVVAAATYDVFAEAVLRKLVLEIAASEAGRSMSAEKPARLRRAHAGR